MPAFLFEGILYIPKKQNQSVSYILKEKRKGAAAVYEKDFRKQNEEPGRRP